MTNAEVPPYGREEAIPAHDPDEPVPGLGSARSIELSFQGDNGRVGDGEGDESRGDAALQGLGSNQTHVAGRLDAHRTATDRSSHVMSGPVGGADPLARWRPSPLVDRFPMRGRPVR